jgi:hypothetical protein
MDDQQLKSALDRAHTDLVTRVRARMDLEAVLQRLLRAARTARPADQGRAPGGDA